jgi:hypothetical protein
MKSVKTIAIFLVIFAVSLVLCAIIGLTGLSYLAVDEVVKATAAEPLKKKISIEAAESAIYDPEAADPNLRSLLAIGRDYQKEFTVFDQMLVDITKKKVPSFCTIVCNPSFLDNERLKTERSHYLKEYYRNQGQHALLDPMFRLKLEEIGFLSSLFPVPLRNLLSEIEQHNQPGTPEQSRLALAVKLEMSVLKEAKSLATKIESIKAEADKLEAVRRLIKSCQEGTLSAKAVRAQCDTLVQ